ncbi:2-dehydropantoate 2-reductase [Ramlibacter sp. 2FC]|uniref:ketopantoate reductase family protein n=1 Tax=Ramlibacter sp. 2FC TaxID=2502188 RepID=UPI0010F9B319|nr:2-dehydropantoate 2-reductase [Ramlibacter sp. 2FC]
MKHPKIAILGTGAQGASIGADLILAGLDVTFIEQWPDHVEAMRRNGITVNLPSRSIHARPRALHLCQVAELREKFDVVLLVVKAYDTKWSCQLIEPYLKKDGFVVGVQNGMSIDDIASVVGIERTIGAVIEIASNMFDPGITNRQNDHDTSWFAVGGLVPSAQRRAGEIAEILGHSGTVTISEDIRSSKWMKLVVNAAELVPSAILDLPLREAARVPGMLDFMRRAGYEAIRAAIGSGSQLVPIFGVDSVDPSRPEKFVDDLFEEVLRTFMQDNTLTTTLQDWRKGRRGEINEVNGYVVTHLARLGHAAPVNARVVEVAHRIEQGELLAAPSNIDLLLANLGPDDGEAAGTCAHDRE